MLRDQDLELWRRRIILETAPNRVDEFAVSAVARLSQVNWEIAASSDGRINQSSENGWLSISKKKKKKAKSRIRIQSWQLYVVFNCEEKMKKKILSSSSKTWEIEKNRLQRPLGVQGSVKFILALSL